MALITDFTPSSSERRSLHRTTVTCGWLSFQTDRGRILQLDTYGSEERKLVGKVTQTVQLDRSGAETLLALVEDVFPGIQARRPTP